MFLEISPLNRHTKIQTFIALFQSFYPSSRSSVWLDQANVIFIDGFPTFSWHLELVVNFSMFGRITRECIPATARLSNHSIIFGFIYCDIHFVCISFSLLKPRFSTRIWWYSEWISNCRCAGAKFFNIVLPLIFIPRMPYVTNHLMLLMFRVKKAVAGFI